MEFHVGLNENFNVIKVIKSCSIRRKNMQRIFVLIPCLSVSKRSQKVFIFEL